MNPLIDDSMLRWVLNNSFYQDEVVVTVNWQVCDAVEDVEAEVIFSLGPWPE